MNPAQHHRLCRRCVASLLQSSPARHASPSIQRRFKTSLSAPAASHSRKAAPNARTPSQPHRCSSTRPGGDPQAQEGVYITSLGHASSDTSRELLKPNNLFHPFSSSPSPPIRLRAAYMRQHAYCPHPSHRRTRYANGPGDPEARKPEPSDEAAEAEAAPAAHVDFECPDCGLPVYCCEEHWMDDYEAHLEVCDTLRQCNEDDHDLRSGRLFPEFEYPGHQRAEEFVLNMSNWDTFFYSRDFPAVDDMRSMRQVTRVMTYPTTITSVLHELSPYNVREGGRLTNEGLRSFSALQFSLFPPLQGQDETVKGLRPLPPPIRIFVLGARAESSLPREVWLQLTHCFPRAAFHLIFIGPESMLNRDHEFPLPERTPRNPFGAVVEDRLGGDLKISTYVEYWHTLFERGEFGVLDPFFDVFVAFHPGLGHPASSFEWRDSLPSLLASKCPIICTGYTPWDMERDVRWVAEQTSGAPGSLNEKAFAGLNEAARNDPKAREALREHRETGEMDILLQPGENIFRSLRWDLNDLDPSDVSCGNWGVWAFRGKRYEATHVGE